MDDANQPDYESTVIPMGRGYFLHTNRLDPSKFLHYFKMAASGLPSGVDDIIERHWKPLCPSSPHFELTPVNTLLSAGGKYGALAVTDLFGKRLRFAAGAIAEIPVELGRDLIIHELAHVHTLSESHFGIIDVEEKHQLQDAGSNLEIMSDLMEKFADKRMQAWGFDPDQIRKWTENYLKKLGLKD